VNCAYERTRDDFVPPGGFRVTLDREALRIPPDAACMLVQPGQAGQRLEIKGETVEIESLELWGILHFATAR
jgi:hypothetical protein